MSDETRKDSAPKDDAAPAPEAKAEDRDVAGDDAEVQSSDAGDDVGSPEAAPLWRRGLVFGARVVGLGAVPGALVYAMLFGLSVWLHRSVEYMGVEDQTTASRVLALFEDEVVAQQLGIFKLYVGIGLLVGLVAFVYWELLARIRRVRLRWWLHGLATLALTFAIHCWFLARSAYHYPQLYSTQLDNSMLLDVVFSLGVDGFEPWFLNLVSVSFWLSLAAFVAVLLYRWALAPPKAGTREDASKSDQPAAANAELARAVRMRRVVVAAGLVAGIGFGWTAAGEPDFRAPQTPNEQPNVLFIAVDSLRGDVVGDGTVTPHIDGFSKRGTRFTHAFSVMPRTFPAWATMLTGQYPHTHGIRHMFPQPEAASVVKGSLAEVLAKAGYRTALISDFAGDVFTRGDFGFQHLDAPEFTLRSNVRLGGLKLHVHLMPYIVDVLRGDGFPELSANERLGDPQWLTDKALRWIGGQGDGAPAAEDRDKPFFLTVFYSAGHFPFAAPAPFYRKFADPNYRGRSRFHKEAYGQPLTGDARVAEEKHLRNLFLGALAASDNAIGRLLDRLEADGVLDNTIVVITADHGENLYEHGLGVGHGDHLYGLAGVHVPLLFSLPAHRANPSPFRNLAYEAVRLLDITPTILAELNVKPMVKQEGVDLRPYMAANARNLPSLPAFAETGLWFYPPETKRLENKMIKFANGFDAFRYEQETWKVYLDPVYEETAVMAKHRMLLDGDRKLLYIPTRSGVRWEMYDTYRDPAESVNLVEREPKRFEAMKAKLFEWMLQDPQMVRVGDYVLPRGPLGPVAEHTAPP